MVKVLLRNQPLELSCINCYDPYHNRTLFWDVVVDEGIFNHPNLIIVGDLNLTLSNADIWGQKYLINPLISYFSQ